MDDKGRRLAFQIRSTIPETDAEKDRDNLSVSEITDIPEKFRNINSSFFYEAFGFDPTFADPIVSVRVSFLKKSEKGDFGLEFKRYSKYSKARYVKAEVEGKHIGTGEGTNTQKKLAEIIRKRGKASEDDCGHIISKAHGGKMVYYNLFPQCMEINRGRGIWSRIWKWGVELLVTIWLTFQANHDPMVRIQIYLEYDERSTYPDRPTLLQYYLEFFKRDDERKKLKESKKDGNREIIKTLIRASIMGDVPNNCFQTDHKKTKDSIQFLYKYLRELKYHTRNKELAELLKMFYEELYNCIVSKSSVMSANKPFSGWDLVPVVGSLRTIDDSIRCAKSGDTTGAVINGILGVGSLALDIFTLGTLSTAAKTIGSAATKTGAKEAAKQGSKQAAKGLTREIVMLYAKAILQAEVKSIVTEGGTLLVSNAVRVTAQKVLKSMLNL